MFSGLSPEEQQYMETQRLEMITLKQTIAGLVEAGTTGFGTGGKAFGKGDGDCGKGGNPRVVFDRKYFQLVDKFEGNPAKIRSWIFELIAVQIEQLDV